MLLVALRAPSRSKAWRGMGEPDGANRRHVVVRRSSQQHRQPSAGAAQTVCKQLFTDVGVSPEEYDRAARLSQEALARAWSLGRAAPVLEALLDVGLSANDIAQVLIKWPQVFTYNVDEDIRPVLEFMRTDVGLTAEGVRTLITRFPVVLSYNVKAHLRPQVAYLHSLGINDELLPSMVLSRPLLLGEGLDTVVSFLRRNGLPRAQMHRMLRSYPIDYCLHFKGLAARVGEEHRS